MVHVTSGTMNFSFDATKGFLVYWYSFNFVNIIASDTNVVCGVQQCDTNNILYNVYCVVMIYGYNNFKCIYMIVQFCVR